MGLMIRVSGPGHGVGSRPWKVSRGLVSPPGSDSLDRVRIGVWPDAHGSELQREIKPEGLAARSLNGKLKLFRREFILSVDSPGLIGVRHHGSRFTISSCRKNDSIPTPILTKRMRRRSHPIR